MPHVSLDCGVASVSRKDKATVRAYSARLPEYRVDRKVRRIISARLSDRKERNRWHESR